MNAAPNAPEGGDFMTPEQMDQRAQDLAAMNAHALMKNSGTLDDDGLAEFLKGGRIQGEGDGFPGFSILFGFDHMGRDFIVVRSDTGGGLHFALTAEDGRVK